MHIIVRDTADREDYEWERLEIFINRKLVFDVTSAEPEDNTLSRNFSDCYNIPKLLEQAYWAGMNGEEISIVTLSDEKDEE